MYNALISLLETFCLFRSKILCLCYQYSPLFTFIFKKPFITIYYVLRIVITFVNPTIKATTIYEHSTVLHSAERRIASVRVLGKRPFIQ